jgi:exodeoxyribonuclease VII large subunit
VEERFSHLQIRGEVSAPKRHTSGHLYFTLKDDSATLDAVCWRPQAVRYGAQLMEGAEVICFGRVTTYPQRSKYQLVVESVTLAGEGALLKLLEQRKQKLRAEGLFDLSRKKPLPFFPRAIGIITSPTGAVIRDILHRLQDRLPCQVYLWPVAVQGDAAADDIARAIDGMNRWRCPSSRPAPDVLIVARGGGSLEDLAAFNEERVVRAAAGSRIPLISAVGHETDTTLIDYAADVRAPTPTAAAEFAVPVRLQLLDVLSQQGSQLRNQMQRLLETCGLRLEVSQRRLLHLPHKLETVDQRLDDVAARLARCWRPCLARKAERVAFLGASLKTPSWVLAQNQLKFLHVLDQLERRIQDILVKNDTLLQTSVQFLHAFSYKKILSRGFCLVHQKKGHVLTSAASVRPPQDLELHFYDGVVEACVSSSLKG